ncbi:MAG: hypothetical protein ACQESA_02460 [Patescibacteria group bacterium]
MISRTRSEREGLSIAFDMNGKSHNSKVFIFSVSYTSQYGSGVYIAPEANDSDSLLNIKKLKCQPLLERSKKT